MICNSCGREESRLLWTVRGHDIHRCPHCGLVFADLRKVDLSGAYEEDYYTKVYADYESDRDIHSRNHGPVLDKIEGLVPRGSLLEIGSAFGFFLDVARKRGWDVHGYEVSQYASEVAREKYGARVTHADFVEATVCGVYDCACAFDTIEHVTDPDGMVRKIASALRIGGCLVITTGDMGSLVGRIFGRHWRLMCPPLHLYYYDARSLAFLLRKHGFTVVSVTHEGRYYLLGSILQMLLRIPKGVLPPIRVKVNIGDVMMVIARKDGLSEGGAAGNA
jgi:SAM-dependent methyltransferase